MQMHDSDSFRVEEFTDSKIPNTRNIWVRINKQHTVYMEKCMGLKITTIIKT